MRSETTRHATLRAMARSLMVPLCITSVLSCATPCASAGYQEQWLSQSQLNREARASGARPASAAHRATRRHRGDRRDGRRRLEPAAEASRDPIAEFAQDHPKASVPGRR